MKSRLLLLLAILFCTLCYGQKKSSTVYTSFETSCLGVDYDGSQTLMAWGEGDNRQDAIENAKKRALHDVIFKGIRSGSGGCNSKPLIFEANAEEKYEQYFFRFFSEGGEFNEFVSWDAADKRAASTQKVKGKALVKCGITVRVLRSELKHRLQTDKIIK